MVCGRPRLCKCNLIQCNGVKLKVTLMFILCHSKNDVCFKIIIKFMIDYY